jgi:hypothetical protein
MQKDIRCCNAFLQNAIPLRIIVSLARIIPAIKYLRPALHFLISHALPLGLEQIFSPRYNFIVSGGRRRDTVIAFFNFLLIASLPYVPATWNEL